MFRLSNALEKIIKWEKNNKIKQVTGTLYDGNKGYCLSGALGCFFGLDKEYLHENEYIHGHEKLYKTFGDAKFNGKCPLDNHGDVDGCGFKGTSIQSFLYILMMITILVSLKPKNFWKI